ncbi:MAG: lamin tail domain-containing protein [Proteobacteria bacterium]|jgi:hypothetical protein|nr:lamin tail domain-containing protein [Pseudomonadota bacterium]
MSRWFLILPLLAACQEYGYSSNLQTDVFKQQSRMSVDLLLVVDNSCSMWQEQDNLAQNFDALIDTFAAADVSWQIGVTTTDTVHEDYRGLLMSGDDEVVLTGPTGELDRVAYTRDWGFEEGVSLQVDGALLSPTKNDLFDNWCASTDEYSTESRGTPGEWNPTCNGDYAPSGTGDDNGPVAPGSGDLVISEIMAESSGLDSLCEWVELTNLTANTLDLAEIEISDLGRNSVVFPVGTTLAPFEPLVLGRSTDKAKNCDTPVDIAFAEGFTLANDLAILDSSTPDSDEAFSELVAQGTTGTGVEMGFEAARLVFEEPYYSDYNQGWLRDDANFSVLFVSDEDDQSPDAVDDYIRYFSDIKGDEAYRNPRVANISAVVGRDPPPAYGYPSCESDNGVGEYGERYLKAANQTGGLVESICAEDFAPIVTRLGLTLSGLYTDFYLSGIPDLSTLEVKLYETDEESSFVSELIRDEDFTYDVSDNKLHFDETQLPPSDYYIVAEYRQLPDSVTYDRSST